jgi:hypothetical protein
MLPIILGIGAAVSALTAGEAVFIGATVGAATAIGAKALKPKQQTEPPKVEDSTEIDEETIREIIRIVKESRL